ncbi:MAG: TonB family protein [Terriglobales bacterium]
MNPISLWFVTAALAAVLSAPALALAQQTNNGSSDTSKSEGGASPTESANQSAANSSAAEPVSLDEEAMKGLIIWRMQPMYPYAAERAHIEGRVRVEVTISGNGSVEAVTRISGDSLLSPAAIDAVKLWRFRPYLSDGRAVSVKGPVSIEFHLSEDEPGAASHSPDARPQAAPEAAMQYENGAVANGVYSNECFGLSFPIPAGWEVNETITPGGKARHRSARDLVLLFLQQQSKKPGRIILSARDATGSGSAQDFVTAAVREQVGIPTEHREIVRETFSVDYGGQHFFRSDYKVAPANGTALYLSYVYTTFRGYLIGETMGAASPAELDEAANSLQGITFRDDQINLKCVMAPAPAPGATGAAGTNPDRVRVAQGVSAGLLIKKVAPDYPEMARQSRIQGAVVLRAVIDKNGDIQDLTLVSGHEMLAPAAIAAVKQWKYKPYLLKGQPVAVETEITVNFSLHGG